MSHLENPGRILVVDDNAQLLSGIQRNLRKVLPIVTANSGDEALSVLKKDRDFSIILSDMRMPGMDGAQFFAEARLLVPDAVRILLTGQADMAAVIAAINDGRIYRFLSKPIDFEDLRTVVGAAMAHYRLQQAEQRERVAMHRAQVDRLEDLLALASVKAWGRAARTRHLAVLLAEQLGLRDIGSIELAAVLEASRLAFPSNVPAALVTGAVTRLASSTSDDPVRAMLTELSAPKGQPLRVGSRVLQVAIAAGDAAGTWEERVETLVRDGAVDGRIAEALRGIHEKLTPTPPRVVEANALAPNMRLVEPLRDAEGTEVAPSGARVTPTMMAVLAACSRPLAPVRVVTEARADDDDLLSATA